MANQTDVDVIFEQRMAFFPCMFNMEQSVYREKNALEAKLETVLEEGDYDQDIRKLNYLTWLQFNLETFRGEEHVTSLKYNDKARLLSQGNEIVSLANRAYLLKRLGEEANSEMCLSELEDIRQSPNFNVLLADAKAQQAYSYARIGEPENQDLAIGLYIEALDVKKDNRWNYGLGLACMRTIHFNMIKYNFRLNTNERVRRGASELFEVAGNDPDVDLRGQSYMNLALLQSYAHQFAKGTFTEEDSRTIFRNMSVEDLIDQAVALGPKDYKIFADCGRALCVFNEDKAKQLLMQSNQIKPNSKAYHQLGFLEKNKSMRMYNWLVALKLSHYGDKAIVRNIHKLLQQSNRDGLLKVCFDQHYQAVSRQLDVLVVAQDQNGQTQNITRILTTCFGLSVTMFNRQTDDLQTEVNRHKLVILVLPGEIESWFSDLIISLVAITSQVGKKVKIIVLDSDTPVPPEVQELNRLSMQDIFENLGNAPINYQTLQGNHQQCISLLRLFNFLTEE